MRLAPCVDHGEQAAHLQHRVLVVVGRITVVEPRTDALQEVSSECRRAPTPHLRVGHAAVDGDHRLGVAADHASEIAGELGERWFMGGVPPEQSERVWMAPGDAEGDPDDAAVAPNVGHVPILELGDELIGDRGEHGAVEVSLVVEVAVHEHTTDAGVLGHVLHRCAVEPGVQERTCGGRDDLGTACLGGEASCRPTARLAGRVR
jgi:hypothetical protein